MELKKIYLSIRLNWLTSDHRKSFKYIPQTKSVDVLILLGLQKVTDVRTKNYDFPWKNIKDISELRNFQLWFESDRVVIGGKNSVR